MLKPSTRRRRLGTRGLAQLGPAFCSELARSALGSDSRVTNVLVFGSYARGTADRSSDLDIAVYYDGHQTDSLDVIGNVAPAVWQRCKSQGLECDVVAFANGSDVARRSPLARRIREEGVDVTYQRA